jgi:hypothetical protein
MKTKLRNIKKPTIALRHNGFVFIPSEHCRDRFDLYRTGSNGNTGKETKKLIGYGYRMEEALLKMIGVRLAERTDITDIQGYVREYKKAKSEIKNLLK